MSGLLSGSSGGKGGRGAKTGGKKGGKLEAGGDDPPTQPQVGVAGGSGQPLLDLVTEEDGQLWMSGNSCLAHLTLSCIPPSLTIAMTTALFPRQPCGTGGCGFTTRCTSGSAKHHTPPCDL